MSKRMIYVLGLMMVIMLVTTSVTFAAEEFQLRNGICFGDTMDDILRKETTLVRESETSNWFNGKIAGYSDAQCGFYFDDDGKMVSMDYAFGNKVCTSKDAMNEVYETLVSSLKRKYGNPIGNYGGNCELITGPAIDRMSLWVYLIGALDGYSGNYYDYDEWIVDVPNGHVKIDIISYYYRDSNYNYHYFVDVSYHFYTDQDYQDAIDKKRGERQEVDNDM